MSLNVGHDPVLEIVVGSQLANVVGHVMVIAHSHAISAPTSAIQSCVVICSRSRTMHEAPVGVVSLAAQVDHVDMASSKMAMKVTNDADSLLEKGGSCSLPLQDLECVLLPSLPSGARLEGVWEDHVHVIEEGLERKAVWVASATPPAMHLLLHLLLLHHMCSRVFDYLGVSMREFERVGRVRAGLMIKMKS